jgi:hypothetical protein
MKRGENEEQGVGKEVEGMGKGGRKVVERRRKGYGKEGKWRRKGLEDRKERRAVT